MNALIMISNMMMQTTGKMVRASFLGMARQGIFLIPAVTILPRFISLLGIQMAQPLADVITFFCCVLLQLGIWKEFAGEEERRN